MTQLAEHFGLLGDGAVAAREPAWLRARREAGRGRFRAVGLPGKKDEEWRLTDVSVLGKTEFVAASSVAAPQAAAAVGRYRLHSMGAELVFVNGCFMPELSRVEGLGAAVEVGNLRDAAVETAGEMGGNPVERYLGAYASIDGNPFVALNVAAWQEGAWVRLRRGATLAQPIHVLHVMLPGERPMAAHPRALVILEEGAVGGLVETFAGEGGVYFTNAVTEIVAGPHSRLDYCRVQQDSLAAYGVSTLQVQLAEHAQFVSHVATLGGKLVRNDLNVVLAGEYAEATLNGLVVIGGEQHVDNHTLLDHAQANCPSHELYKHVLGGKAGGVFKGKILVRPGAQKTDSKQTSKSLLLTDEAVMDSQPALEIYADDVKCTHGCSTGPVDEEQVFYLRSRGIAVEAARHLMTYAFAADITRRIKMAAVRERLENFLAAQHGLPQDLRIADLGGAQEAVKQL